MWDGLGNGVCPNKTLLSTPPDYLRQNMQNIMQNMHTSYTSNKERSKTLRRSVVDDNFG